MTDETLDENTPDRAPGADATATAPARDDDAAAGASSPSHDGTSAETSSPSAGAVAAGGAAADRPQYGVGPFTVREVALGGVWLLAFVVSFFPVNLLLGEARALIGGTNVWVSGLSWILAIGLPTVAVFLLALRRLSPEGIRRVGSLGIDQFASVAFTVSAVLWLSWLWETVAIAVQFGLWARSWVIWVEVVLMLAGVALTVFAPLLPVLKDDFAGRREVPAHRNARPVRAVTPRPVRERPARPAPAPVASDGGEADPSAAGPFAARGAAGSGAYAYGSGAYAPPSDDGADTSDDASDDTSAPGAHRSSYEPARRRDTGSTDDTGSIDDTATATDVFAPLTEPDADDTAVHPTAHVASAQQAFWALVPEERDVVDDYGRPLFRIGPTAWALVIEDRGAAYVVRHEDGRIGYLHDVSGVTRG